jgi:hypothetical protein
MECEPKPHPSPSLVTRTTLHRTISRSGNYDKFHLDSANATGDLVGLSRCRQLGLNRTVFGERSKGGKRRKRLKDGPVAPFSVARLRSALNAPHKARRRAPLRRATENGKPAEMENQQLRVGQKRVSKVGQVKLSNASACSVKDTRLRVESKSVGSKPIYSGPKARGGDRRWSETRKRRTG